MKMLAAAHGRNKRERPDCCANCDDYRNPNGWKRLRKRIQRAREKRGWKREEDQSVKKINPRLPIEYDGEMRQLNRWRVDAVQAEHKGMPRLDARVLEVISRCQGENGLSWAKVFYLYSCVMKVLEEEEG